MGEEILQQTYNSFPKILWKCAVDPLITLEIPLNFLIWDVWEPCKNSIGVEWNHGRMAGPQHAPHSNSSDTQLLIIFYLCVNW